MAVMYIYLHAHAVSKFPQAVRGLFLRCPPQHHQAIGNACLGIRLPLPVQALPLPARRPDEPAFPIHGATPDAHR